MLLYFSLFTILMSFILLIHNWRINKNSLYLASFFGLFALYGIIHYLTVFGNSAFWLAVLFNHFTPLMLLLGPLLLFYVRGTLKDTESLSKIDLLHFIPSVIQLIGITPYIFSPFDLKLKIANSLIQNINSIKGLNINLFFSPAFNLTLRPFLLFAYLMYCIYLFSKYYPINKKSKLIPKKQLQITRNWLLLLLSTVFIVVLSFIVVTIISIYKTPSYGLTNIFQIHTISGIAFFIMSFSLLLFPNITYGFPKKTTTKLNKSGLKETKSELETTSTENPFAELTESILIYLENEKPYLNYDFAISDIYIAMKVPNMHVSYCINTLMNTKFSKIKAEYRVKHAINLLENGMSNTLTIEAIGEQSGFKTRSNFYAAFKEITGITPTEYVQNFNQE